MLSRLTRGLWPLTRANIKSFYRDRAALFWTFAFPILFVILFGYLFSGSPSTFDVGWVDEEQSAASTQLHDAFAQVPLIALQDATRDDALKQMRDGKLDAVIVVPAGLAAAVQPGTPPAQPFNLTVYTDPCQQTSSGTVQQIVAQVVGGINQRLSGRPPSLAVDLQPLQTEGLTNAAYFVPSILGMALMQLGVFAAIPLVSQREKLILKRLNATPLSRGTLVLSNVLMRLIIALVQTLIIVGIGMALFGVRIVGSPLLVAGLVVLGAMTFLSIGYVIASYARTEDTANSLASVVQFPLMFLSGIFFPIDFMPELAAASGGLPAADLPGRRAAPDDGRWRRVRAPVARHSDPGGLADRLAGCFSALLPLAVARRPPVCRHERLRLSPAGHRVFYPPTLRSADLLAHYAARLTAVELNNTFYRQPRPAAIESWLAATPADFRFVVKAQRGGSMRALGEAAAQTVELADAAISALWRTPGKRALPRARAGPPRRRAARPAARRLAGRHAADARIPASVMARRRGLRAAARAAPRRSARPISTMSRRPTFA